jgi:hypothetical protein
LIGAVVFPIKEQFMDQKKSSVVILMADDDEDDRLMAKEAFSEVTPQPLLHG